MRTAAHAQTCLSLHLSLPPISTIFFFVILGFCGLPLGKEVSWSGPFVYENLLLRNCLAARNLRFPHGPNYHILLAGRGFLNLVAFTQEFFFSRHTIQGTAAFHSPRRTVQCFRRRDVMSHDCVRGEVTTRLDPADTP